MAARATHAKPSPAMNEDQLTPLLARIAEALDRLAPARQAELDLAAADAFVWRPGPTRQQWLLRSPSPWGSV